jgi:hypothetical protein
MQAPVVFLGVLEILDNVFCRVELAFLDALIDFNNVLPHDSASANVQMP